MSCCIRTASPLWCPWQTIGLAPPLVSMRTFDSSTPVWTFTEAMCAIWIVSCCRPNQRGTCWTTLVGVMRTWVGRRRLPALMRLARKTSPDANGRPLLQIHTTTRTAITPITPRVSVTGSTAQMLSYFAQNAFHGGHAVAAPRAWLARALSQAAPVRHPHSLLPTDWQL